MDVVSLGVSFRTTTDDKDRQDVVSISAATVANGVLDGAAIEAGNITWENNSDIGPFGLWFKGSFDSSTIDFTVSKNGEDGWDFQVTVYGIDKDGNRKTLVNAVGLRLDKNTKSSTLRLSA
jgi:hypothetical protein